MKAKSTFLFSNVELRQRLIDLCPPQYKEAFATSLFNGDYITRKLNTNRKKQLLDLIDQFLFSANLLLRLVASSKQPLMVDKIGSRLLFIDHVHQ